MSDLEPLKIVTIFGGARPQRDDPAYEEARQLGSLLGQAGYAVMTGGYSGTMEAASRGAAEAGGYVIGVTSDEIERWRPQGPNAWVKEERRTNRLDERMAILIEDCDAAIALPGGVGSLLEVALMWNRLIIGALNGQPLILIGSGWRQTFDTFIQTQGQYIGPDSAGLLTFVDDIAGAVAAVQQALTKQF
jgi:uncharacterized protein (TIGR00730 family)